MQSLSVLYEELRVPVYKFALSIVKSPHTAEDIAQETFLRIRVNAHTYRPKSKPKAWIFAIVHNLAVSELRRTSRLTDYEQELNSKSTAFELDESSVLLDLLNPDEREIVSLHVLADLKHSDIAKALDLPYSQVRWKYAYAIKKLRKHLEKEGM
jgi:RNA polymerase sigma-70 factor (ECF subfamily)